MSAQPNESNRGTHPNSLANLKLWKAGQSANPGGQLKGGNRVDVEYQKILNLTAEEIRDYKPTNGAQILAWKQYKEACTNPNSLGYAQEITNRTSGKVADKLELTAKYDSETKQSVVIEAYYRLFSDKEEDEALEAIRAIYRAKRQQDEAAMRLAVQAAIEQDSEAISGYWSDAEKAVLGERVP